MIKVIEKRLKQVEAADILDISVRQMKRLVKKIRVHREEGLVLKKRGSPINHQLSKGLKEVHHVKISISTVRALMIEKEPFKLK